MSAALSGCTWIQDVGNFIFRPPTTEPTVAALSTDEAAAAGEGDEDILAVDDGIDPDAYETLVVDQSEWLEVPDGTRLPILETRQYDSGLLVHDLRLGDGAVCQADSEIIIHYHGTLADGTVVDSTRDGVPRGPWPLDQLMPGWREGLIGMEAGGIRQLVIPPSLGYGDRAINRSESDMILIPARASLVYVIELIEVR